MLALKFYMCPLNISGMMAVTREMSVEEIHFDIQPLVRIMNFPALNSPLPDKSALICNKDDTRRENCLVSKDFTRPCRLVPWAGPGTAYHSGS